MYEDMDRMKIVLLSLSTKSQKYIRKQFYEHGLILIFLKIVVYWFKENIFYEKNINIFHMSNREIF